MLAAIAVLGYSHHWASARVFVGVRNVNEDFFTSPVTALFANSSCGIVPTIAASYPIANYPFSGLTFYFDVTRGRFTFRNSLCNGVGRNGWRHDDNPFLLRPKSDGVFNMSQLEYAHRGAHYFAGAAIHTPPVCPRRRRSPDARQRGIPSHHGRLVGLWRATPMAARKAEPHGHGPIL